MLPDPKLSLICYTTKAQRATPHRRAIAEIAESLHKFGIRDLNYDHVRTMVPKVPVPLFINDRRFDVAYRHNGYLVLIDVFAFEEKDIEILMHKNGDS